MAMQTSQWQIVRRREHSISVAGVAAGLAGAVTAIGTFMEWLSLNSLGIAFEGGSVQGSVKGLDTGIFGWAALALGAGILLAAPLLRAGGRRWPAWLSILFGMGAIGIAVVVFIFRDSVFVDFAARTAASREVPASTVRTLVEGLFPAGSSSVSPSIGLYVTGIGGALAVIGGMIGARRRRPPQQGE
jgi:hypothetical protein